MSRETAALVERLRSRAIGGLGSHRQEAIEAYATLRAQLAARDDVRAGDPYLLHRLRRQAEELQSMPDKPTVVDPDPLGSLLLEAADALANRRALKPEPPAGQREGVAQDNQAVTDSSGCVFADLGLPAPTWADVVKLRGQVADLMEQLHRERHLTAALARRGDAEGA